MTGGMVYNLSMLHLLRHTSVQTHISQLWKFVISGGTGFILDVSSLSLFVEYFGIDPRLAVVFSTCVGASFVFVVNKFFTFRNREKSYGNQFFKFLLVYGVSFISNIAISNALIWFGSHYIVAKIVAVGIGAFWNYALSHGFIFKKNEEVDVVVV